MSAKQSFTPVGADRPRLLILGSLPGDRSLAERQYYAHPTNQFWRLMELVLDEPLAAANYPTRLQLLAAHGVALWDVIGRAHRQGSGDGAIRNAIANPLVPYCQSCDRLEAIAFNGRKASEAGRRALRQTSNVSLIDLPSSSAAFTIGLAKKAEKWAALREYVD